MRFVIFTHSLVSDWNHGNAHFLRGVTSELISQGSKCESLNRTTAGAARILFPSVVSGQCTRSSANSLFCAAHSTTGRLLI